MKFNLALLCATLLVTGCSVTSKTNGAGGACKSNADCNAGLSCSNGACSATSALTGGGSAGGTDGVDTGGSTASSGADSGASSGDSAGASSGDGASSGASSGSSSGTAPGLASHMIRFVNGASNTQTGATTALDLCVSATTTFAAGAGITGITGVAYAHAADFVTVPSGALYFRVIAAGDDCNTGTSLFDNVTAAVDVSSGGPYTAVAYSGDGTSVTGLIVSGTAAPAAGQAHLTFDNATGHGHLANLSTGLPYQVLAVADVGVAVAHDVSPFAATALTFEDDGATFAGQSLAAGAQSTAIVFGFLDDDTGTSFATQLVVCDDTAATGGCTATAGTNLAYLRVANSSAAAVDVCTSPSTGPGAGTFTPLTNATALAPDSVSAFIAVPNAAFTQFDFKAVAGGAGCASTAVATLTARNVNAGAYETMVVNRNPSGGSRAVLDTAFPVAPGTVGLQVSIINGTIRNSANFGPVLASFPTLFGKYLSLTNATSNGAVVQALVPAELEPSFAGSTLRVLDTATRYVDFTLPAFPLAGSAIPASVSLFLSGDVATTTSHAILCDNTGAPGPAGLSVCVIAAAASAVNDGSTIPPYVRVANLSAAAGTTGVCAAAGVTELASSVAVATVTAFAAYPALTAHFSLADPVTGCTVDTGINTNLTPGDYYTVYITGDSGTPVITPVDEGPDNNANAGHFKAAAFNGWAANTVSAVRVATGTALADTLPIDTRSVLRDYTVDNAAPFTLTKGTAVGIAGTSWTFALPTTGADRLLSTCIYDAMIVSASADATDAAIVLWCNNQAVDVTGTLTACTPLSGSHD